MIIFDHSIQFLLFHFHKNAWGICPTQSNSAGLFDLAAKDYSLC